MSQRSSGHNYRADSGRVVRSEPPKRRTRSGPPRRRLHARPRRASVPARAGHLLDRGRQPRDHGRLVARHRHLFRLPRRRADAADRAAEGEQFAYEDRIAELRAQVDRITSRQLLDQEQFEQKLDQIMRRQATLESRASTLARRARSGADRLDQEPPDADGRAAPAGALKASPISDTVIFTTPPDREARLESRELPARRGASPQRSQGRRSASRARWRACRLARSCRDPADRDAQRARGALRLQGQAHSRRAGRPRHRCQEGRAAARRSPRSAGRSCR